MTKNILEHISHPSVVIDEGEEIPISVIFEGTEDEIVDAAAEWLQPFGHHLPHIGDKEAVVVEVRVGWLAFHGFNEPSPYRDVERGAVWCDSFPWWTFGASEMREWMLGEYRQDFIQLLRGGPEDYENNKFLKVWIDNYIMDDSW